MKEIGNWALGMASARGASLAEARTLAAHAQSIGAGDEILLLYPSANRDPRAFDEPDTFDVTRSGNRHVAFGFGSHFCLGAHLARLEIRVMFEEILRRMPDWELVDPEEPKIIPATFARAFDRIRIRFTPS